ncbi:hypothetical protein JCM11251_005821 [Rhodosporidiobolus azoricus]
MLASRATFASAIALFASLASVSAGKTPEGVFDGDAGSTLIDYQPPFTSPKEGDVMFAGMSYFASWNQELPDDISVENVSTTADLVMGYKVDGETSLHLNWTLVKDVPLYAPNPSSVDFTLPADLETKDSYFLVLLGSTHNQSPEFTIVANPVAKLLSGGEASGTPYGGGEEDAPAATTTTSAAPAATTTPAAQAVPFRRRSEAGKVRLA